MSFVVLFYHKLLKEGAVFYAHFVNSSTLELNVDLHFWSTKDYSLLRPIRKNASFAREGPSTLFSHTNRQLLLETQDCGKVKATEIK